jgi:hypothetical protein
MPIAGHDAMTSVKTTFRSETLTGLLPSTLATAARQATSRMLALPFDIARAQYASAVRLGVVRRSMLDGRAFEQSLGAIERLTLGVFARRV